MRLKPEVRQTEATNLGLASEVVSKHSQSPRGEAFGVATVQESKGDVDDERDGERVRAATCSRC